MYFEFIRNLRLFKPWLHTKTLLVMRLVILLTIVASIHASAGVRAQTVSLSRTNVPLETIFKDIKKQTGYDFIYNSDLLKGANLVTIDLKNVSLEAALEYCFRNQLVSYSIIEKTIVLKEKVATVAKLKHDKEEISSLKFTAHGIVMSELGTPLAGANVTDKKTGKGTITNAKGEFAMLVENGNSLTVSYIGYQVFEVKVQSEAPLKVFLKIATNELDKVVVQAYGSTTARLNTGNITTVTAAEIERQPVMNPLAALQGQVPGLVITQTSGYASAPFKAEIRGRSTISTDLPSEPLYIIDGVPLTTLSLGGQTSNSYQSGSFGVLQNGYMSGPANGQSPFFNINPADIESISVLKDADATAIYGSRGANGVIIITTKNGKPGKTKLDLSVYQGMSEVTGRYPMMNTQQFLMMRKEAFKNDGIAPNAGNDYDLLVWDTTRYTDWQKFLWGNKGHTTDAELSISGGDKQNTFRIGGSYHNETSILSYSGADQRGSVQFNFAHKSLDQKLSISFQNLYSFTQSNLIPLSASVLLPPDAPAIFDQQNKLNFSGWSPVSSNLDVFGSLMQPYISKTGFLNSELKIEYAIFEGLTFRSQLGYSTTHNTQINTFPISSLNPQETSTGSASFGNNNNSNLIVEPQLEFQHFINKGKLNILFGGSGQRTTQDGAFQQGNGYSNDNFLQSISNAPQKFASEVGGQYRYEAVFGRLNYNWEDKYLINLSARRDGSSRFGAGKQFGNFGAIGAAWIFTEAKWAKKNFQVLSFGKLRGSYGITGSDQIGDYGFLTRWAELTQPYQGTGSYIPLQHANPTLQWEVNKKIEMALELGFVNDRFKLEVSAYQNRCGNQLISETLPALTAFNTVSANSPAEIQNRGIEAVIKANLINSKDFMWSVHFNIGINRNKLIAFPDLDKSPYANTFIIGRPLGLARLLHYTGVDPATGQYTYFDKNHDGQLNVYASDTANDLYIKDLTGKYDGGFGTDFRYKGLQLNVLFTFRQQTLPSALYTIIPGSLNGVLGNQSTAVLDRWQKPGDHSKFARFTTQPTDNDNYFTSSDGIYSNASYIRLRNLSLSYDLPLHLLGKSSMPSAKVYVRGENIFVITKYHGIDPDAPGYGALPPAKIFTCGVQFNF